MSRKISAFLSVVTEEEVIGNGAEEASFDDEEDEAGLDTGDPLLAYLKAWIGHGHISFSTLKE